MQLVTSWLPELSDGAMIVVQGTVEKEEDGKFLLDFCRSTNATAALHLCVTFGTQIFLNLQMAGDAGFSFRRGFRGTGVLRFEMIVLVSDGNFKISLNGCHVCEAPHLISLKEIDRLEVNGNVQLHRIFYQRPCRADQQINGDHSASEKSLDVLGIRLPADSNIPAESVIREAQPDPEILQKHSDLHPEPLQVGDLNAPSSAPDASSETNSSKTLSSTKNRGANVSEADSSNQRSGVDLPGGCLNVGLSSGDAPQLGNAFDATRGSLQNPSAPRPSKAPGSAMEAESLENPTTPEHFELPYAYPSPQNPAVPISSGRLYSPTEYELTLNPLMPNHPDALHPPTSAQNPVILGQSNAPLPYLNESAAIHGNSNLPYLHPGYPCHQNPVIPSQWNNLFPLPGMKANQNPTATCQSNVPLPLYPYQGYTHNLYPPLPSGSVNPYPHSGHETHQQNPVPPAYGPPPYNPYYGPPWPNYNQQPGADTVPTQHWTHLNVKYFPEGLKINQVINMYGDLPPSCSGFSVRLLNGDTEDANVFLDMAVSFPDRTISRSRKMYNRWSQIENSLSHFPFQVGKPFHVVVVCGYNLFRAFANEAHMFDFQASMNLSEITSVRVFGLVTAVNITVS